MLGAAILMVDLPGGFHELVRTAQREGLEYHLLVIGMAVALLVT
jgi:hypothetical protein